MNRFRSGLWWAALLVILVGIGASFYLTREHFLHLGSLFTEKSLCNVSAYLNCDMVITSRYATIGVLPLAGLGLIFYIYLLGALLYARLAQESLAEILGLPCLLSFLAILLSFFLGYISFHELHALCIFCISLYVVNFLIFFLLQALVGRGDPMKFLNVIPWWKSLTYLGIVFAIGSVILYTNHKQYAKELSPNDAQEYLHQFFAQKPIAIDTAGRPFWGNPDAKVVIAEFSDMECPYCRVAAFNLKPILTDYKDKIKLVFMNYPLDKSCNPQMQRELHEQSCQAAYAAYCASIQGKFWEYHDEAFKRQPKFSTESLESIAKKLGMDVNAFNACRSSEATKQFVAQDLAEGAKAKVEGTPTIFINGRMFPNWISKQLMSLALDKLLAEGK